VRRGWAKCCSFKCRNKNQQTGRFYPCGECKKEVYRTPAEFKKSITGKVFCSHHCSTIASNKQFKKGYDHPNFVNGNSIYRKSALLKYGFKCDSKEKCPLKTIKLPNFLYEVDHIDNNHHNNKLENLRVLCVWCHRLKHTGCGKKVFREAWDLEKVEHYHSS
jgi:YHS domain-containing protein